MPKRTGPKKTPKCQIMKILKDRSGLSAVAFSASGRSINAVNFPRGVKLGPSAVIRAAKAMRCPKIKFGR